MAKSEEVNLGRMRHAHASKHVAAPRLPGYCATVSATLWRDGTGRKIMNRRSILSIAAMTVLGLALLPGSTVAQQPPAVRTVSPAFNAKLDLLEPLLSTVEQHFAIRAAAINATKAVSQADMDTPAFFDAVQGYASALKARYDEAANDANAAAISEGREGNVANLQRFEDFAKAHADRLTSLQARADNIQTQIRSGAIQPDREILLKATPQERADFQSFLTPGGRTQIQERHPDLFPRTSLDFPQYAGSVVPASPLFSKLRKSGAGSRTSLIAGWIVTPAEAAISAGCVLVCTAVAAGTVTTAGTAVATWPLCFACVGGVLARSAPPSLGLTLA
jgi:hypothetical protein